MTELVPIEIEAALLGAILNDPGALDVVDRLVVPADFGDAFHRRLYETFHAAHVAGRRIDIRLAQYALGADGSVAITTDCNLNQYVARLAAGAIGTRQAPDYARIVRDQADRRRLVDAADRLKAVAAGAHPVTDIAVEAIEELDAIASSRSSSHVARISMGAGAEQFVEDMAVAMQNPGRITGTTTGLSDLDAKTGGFQRGELAIIGGRPGMGKSALAVSSGRQASAAGCTGIYFSLEMTPKALCGRALTDAIFDSATRSPIPTRGPGYFRTTRRSASSTRNAISDLPLKLIHRAA
jgi:replicative DNA helicase